MSSVPEGNRYAPPTAHVEDISGSPGGIELAGRGTRLGAVLIDFFIQLAAVWVLSMVTPFNPWDPAQAANSMSQSINTLVGGVLFVVIQGFLLVTRGQTIGKMLLNIRIVRTDGSKASAGRIIGLRYLLGSALTAIPYIGYVYALVDCLMIFRASHKCLHDHIADTIVIQA